MNANIANLLTENRIVPGLRAADRWQGIDDLLDKLMETGTIRRGERDVVAASVRKCEQSVSTGIGFGIGILHATTKAISAAVVALSRSKQGSNFDALDGQPVRIVVLSSSRKAGFKNSCTRGPESPGSHATSPFARRSTKLLMAR